MAQEFTVKSEQIENKINQLLPSQGGFGAGVDISASTMVIPIVDVTETAEGSTLRQDLQTSLSLTSASAFNVVNTTTTIINTTGYFRIFGSCNITTNAANGVRGDVNITDGFTSKVLVSYNSIAAIGTIAFSATPFDFIVKVEAGQSVTLTSSSGTVQLRGNTRQIADINGNLVNP